MLQILLPLNRIYRAVIVLISTSTIGNILLAGTLHCEGTALHCSGYLAGFPVSWQVMDKYFANTTILK